MNRVLIVNRKECEEILTPARCIPEMRKSLAAISNGRTKVLQRTMIIHDNDNKLANMPASNIREDVTGAKITIFPGVETAKKGTSGGIIPLFRISDGSLKAIVDAGLITVMRTAATSAAATDVLARTDAENLAILGCGKEGMAHVRAIMLVRNIKSVTLWNRTRARAEKAAEILSGEYPAVKFTICADVKSAVENADIICTTTTGRSPRPFLKGRWIKPGAHINRVGACTATGREVDGETIEKSKIFTDWTEAVLRDAGDILIPVNNGEIKKMPEMTEAGRVINGTAPGRESNDEITFFESVGISVEDISAANMIYEYATEAGIGTFVEI